MKITNQHQLPDIFCEAVSLFDSDYDRGDSDYTATELIKPVRINVLTKRHWSDLSEDVSDRVWALGGQVKHLIFRRLAEKYPERYIAERRMFATVDDTKVSGQLDLYDRQTSVLWDYKESSVWKFVIGDTADWEAQANINRYCLEAGDNDSGNGESGNSAGTAPAPLSPVSALQNLVILKDWKAREAEKKPDYPQCAVSVVDIPIWSDKECETFIGKRIEEYRQGEIELPLCTSEEMWERPAKFAACKRGRKSAVKLHDTEGEAVAHVSQLGAGHYIERRPNERVRCERYCPVSDFCEQFRDYKLSLNESH
jgi:hypothetical protein